MVEEVVKRVNFHNGLFLTEEEFRTEQDYHIQMRRKMHSLNREYGILDGLKVQPAQDKNYTVTPGVALSKDGAEIFLSSNKEISLSGKPDGVYYVTIRYGQHESEPDESKGSETGIYLLEDPEIKVELKSQDFPHPEKDIILAKINIPPTEWEISLDERREIGHALRSINHKVSIGTPDKNEDLEVYGKVEACKFKGDGSELNNVGRWNDIKADDNISGIYFNKGKVVGIGTSTPSSNSNLHIDPKGPGGILIGDGEGKFTRFSIEISGREGYAALKSFNGVHLSLNPDKDHGNVGIGVENPREKLHVKGSIKIENGQLIQDNWTNAELIKPWERYSDDYNSPGFFRDTNGIVHLRGVVKAGDKDSTLFNLPEGYRPEKIESHTVYVTDEDEVNLIGRCEISPNRGVALKVATDKKIDFLTLDGITFRAKIEGK